MAANCPTILATPLNTLIRGASSIISGLSSSDVMLILVPDVVVLEYSSVTDVASKLVVVSSGVGYVILFVVSVVEVLSECGETILVDDFSDVVESDESSTVLDFEIVEVLDGICKLLECDNDDNAEVIPLPDVPVVSVEIIEMLGVVLDEG